MAYLACDSSSNTHLPPLAAEAHESLRLLVEVLGFLATLCNRLVVLTGPGDLLLKHAILVVDKTVEFCAGQLDAFTMLTLMEVFHQLIDLFVEPDLVIEEFYEFQLYS
jgi:hypothetical protein